MLKDPIFFYLSLLLFLSKRLLDISIVFAVCYLSEAGRANVNAYISSKFIANKIYSYVLAQVEPATFIPLATRCKQVFLVTLHKITLHVREVDDRI